MTDAMQQPPCPEHPFARTPHGYMTKRCGWTWALDGPGGMRGAIPCGQCIDCDDTFPRLASQGYTQAEGEPLMPLTTVSEQTWNEDIWREQHEDEP